MIWVGDDWAEDYHDVELLGEDGRRLTRARLPEGLEGITRLHALITTHAPASWTDLDPQQAADQVRIGIETDRGMWIQALLAAGYQVYAINPMSVARYRERHSTSGAKSDAGDAHVVAEIVLWTTPTTGRSPATAPGQTGRPGASEPDLGSHPAGAAAAVGAAGVLPGRVAGLRRAGRR